MLSYMAKAPVPPKVTTRQLFGRNVRTLRRLREMTQEELANKAGIQRAHVTLIERGAVNFTIDTMEVVAHAMGLEVRDLLDETLELTHLRIDKRQ
jgi:transcriptional regulator with XRE-family HTH domain